MVSAAPCSNISALNPNRLPFLLYRSAYIVFVFCLCTFSPPFASPFILMSSSEVPETIYHLARKVDWDAAVSEERDYFTESLQKEGITHASAGLDILLDIANSFYKGKRYRLSMSNALSPCLFATHTEAPGDFVLLHVRTAALNCDVKMVQGRSMTVRETLFLL